jgi:Holliday junction resolvase RusA-like endonuclease
MVQIIHGTVPSKSNCYKIIHNGKHSSLAKTPALVRYENLFYIQCNNYRNANIKGYFEFYIDVFYPSQRSDLDNSLKMVLDCLQKVKAIKNDNKCVKIVAQKFLDKLNPRIEFRINAI